MAAPTRARRGRITEAVKVSRVARFGVPPFFTRMIYKHYKNSNAGTHCVQACLQTLLHYFDMAVLSFEELDKITGHNPDRWTWMSKAILWLSSQNLRVIHYENLDYERFAAEGKEYLKMIWYKETFDLQDRMSDLPKEREDAKALLDSRNVTIVNDRLALEGIKNAFSLGFFILLSVNPNVLKGSAGYGSHMVVISGLKDGKIQICDPDGGLDWYDESVIRSAISPEHKPDFSATLVGMPTTARVRALLH